MAPHTSLEPAFFYREVQPFFFMLLLSSTPISCQSAALAHLDSLPLMIWYPGLMALFLFLLAKAALMYLPTSLAVARRPLFSSQQAQYAPVFVLKPARFCKLLAGLGSINKSAISILLSSYLTLVLSSSPVLSSILLFYLKRCGRSSRNCLLSPHVLSDYNGCPDTRFSRRMTRLMSWPHGECYSCLLQPLVVSLLLSLVSTLVFSRTGHRNSLTHRFLRFSPRNSCSLVTLAVFSLVYAAADTAFC